MSAGSVTNNIDQIDSKDPNGLRIVFFKPAGNKTALNYFALDPNNYITKQMLIDLGLSTSVVEDVAAAGTANPIVIPFTGSDKPIVEAFVKLSSDGTGKTLTNRQLVLQYDLTFDDVDCTVINGVNIYGNDDGTGHLNEDVYYRIQG